MRARKSRKPRRKPNPAPSSGLGFIIPLIQAAAAVAPIAYMIHTAEKQRKEERKAVSQAITAKQQADAAFEAALEAAKNNPVVAQMQAAPAWVKPAAIAAIGILGVSFLIYKIRAARARKAVTQEPDQEPDQED